MRKVNEFEQERDSQEDDSMIRRSNSTSIKPTWLEDYDVGTTAIQEVPIKDE